MRLTNLSYKGSVYVFYDVRFYRPNSYKQNESSSLICSQISGLRVINTSRYDKQYKIVFTVSNRGREIFVTPLRLALILTYVGIYHICHYHSPSYVSTSRAVWRKREYRAR